MIEVDVRRRLPAFAVDARFTAAQGITALFGRSGAGKTTVINMLAGLVRPDEGRIAVDGRVLFDHDAGIDLAPEKRRLGYVFQEDRLFPHLSVRGNLGFGARRAPAAERRIDFDAVVALLDLGGLLARRPARLSGGERQRVAIGRALLACPSLLLMDEPLAGLDARRRAEIMPFVENLRDRLTVPIVYVTHNIDEIIRLADTVVLIEAGRVAAAGPLEEIMTRLDLSAVIGSFDAGAVMRATVADHDAEHALTRLTIEGGALTVSRLDLPVGASLRVRLRARDVILALHRPADISTLNVLHGTVTELRPAMASQTDVLVDVGSRLWARVTRRSVEELGLEPGKEVFALVKSVALDHYAGGFADETR